MDVIGIIHAGGKGERLRPLTLSIPKPLIEIGKIKKPVIYWSMLPAILYGVKRFVITTNYLSEKIEKYFKGEEWKEFEIVLYRERGNWGSAGAVKYCLKEGIIDEKATVLMQNAADITRNFIDELIKFHRKNSDKYDVTIVAAERCVIPSSKVEYDPYSGAVKGFRRRPEHRWKKGEASHVGMFVFSPRGMKKFESAPIPSNPEDSVVQELIKEGRANVFLVDSWIPIKYRSDILEANKIDIEKYILGEQG